MGLIMRTKIIKIGNSRGIRIPKPLIKEAGLQDEVDISFRDNALVISPVRQPRQDWAESFKEMQKHGDDVLLEEELLTWSEWDRGEWEW
jgi:antitoxin MazE